MNSGMTGQSFQSFGSRIGCRGNGVMVGCGLVGAGDGVTAGRGGSVGVIISATGSSDGTKVAVGAGVDTPVQELRSRQTNKDMKTERLIIHEEGRSETCPTSSIRLQISKCANGCNRRRDLQPVCGLRSIPWTHEDHIPAQ